MNAYSMYDAIEERKWVQQKIKEESESWIERRAQELISALPKTPVLLSLMLKADNPTEAAASASLNGDKAKDAFNDFIAVCAYEKAEAEWELKVADCPF